MNKRIFASYIFLFLISIFLYINIPSTITVRILRNGTPVVKQTVDKVLLEIKPKDYFKTSQIEKIGETDERGIIQFKESDEITFIRFNNKAIIPVTVPPFRKNVYINAEIDKLKILYPIKIKFLDKEKNPIKNHRFYFRMHGGETEELAWYLTKLLYANEEGYAEMTVFAGIHTVSFYSGHYEILINPLKPQGEFFINV